MCVCVCVGGGGDGLVNACIDGFQMSIKRPTSGGQTRDR